MQQPLCGINSHHPRVGPFLPSQAVNAQPVPRAGGRPPPYLRATLFVIGLGFLIQITGTVVSLAIVDRLGRRPTLLAGIAAMICRRSCSPSSSRAAT